MSSVNEVQFATLDLFKAFVINDKKTVKLETVNAKAVRSGVYFSKELENCICRSFKSLSEKAISLYGVDMVNANNAFHKSFSTVRDSSMEKLIFQQILHYMTTYGAESVGLYDEDSVYVPAEQFDIPDSEPVKLVIIHGLTKEEVSEKVNSLLASGIALSTNSVQEVLCLIRELKINIANVDEVKNKEVRIALYDLLNVVPKHPAEFLKYTVYKIIGDTMLVNNNNTIKRIKEALNNELVGQETSTKMLNTYIQAYDMRSLATIFYRYKNIFLAMKRDSNAHTINAIRRLAVKYHKPLKKGVLDKVTSEKVSVRALNSELKMVTIFKKVSLLNAMAYRLSNPTSIVYRIRNGHSFATEYEKKHDISMSNYNAVLNSIVKDLKKKVKGKTFIIPDNVHYAFPTSEKQFCGAIPFGTVVDFGKNAIFGVHWENQNGCRIDLDLSQYNLTERFGWNGSWRRGDDVLFTGDMTDAPAPEGATEAYFLGEGIKEYALMVKLNNFTGAKGTIKYQMILDSPKSKARVDENYILDNATKLVSVSMEMKEKEDSLGVVISDENGNKSFSFMNMGTGKEAISRVDEKGKHLFRYALDTVKTQLKLNQVLELAGATIVNSKEGLEPKTKFVDLSLESLTKTTLIDLITK